MFNWDALRHEPSAQEPQGRVVYQKSTSRVYNVHGQCLEETSKETDGVMGTQTLTVNRALGDRHAGVVHSRNLRDTTRQDQVESTGNVADPDAFDAEWMQQARRYLPQYRDALPGPSEGNTDLRRNDGFVQSHHHQPPSDAPQTIGGRRLLR